jgi:hypothetical protein
LACLLKHRFPNTQERITQGDFSGSAGIHFRIPPEDHCHLLCPQRFIRLDTLNQPLCNLQPAFAAKAERIFKDAVNGDGHAESYAPFYRMQQLSNSPADRLE